MLRRLITWIPGIALLLTVACSNDNPGPTVPPVTPPAAASDLYCSRTSAARVTLRWRDNSDSELGFRIQRREGAEGVFTDLPDTLVANRASFDDRTVQTGQSYTYRVVAYVWGADAAPSNEVTVQAVQNSSPTVPQAVNPPDGMSDIAPDAVVDLQWLSVDADGDPIRYEVRFGATLRGMTIVDSATTGTSHTLPGPFDRNSHYFWQVVAKDPKGVSTPSPIYGFNTVVDRDLVPAGPFFMGADPEQEPSSPFVHPGNPVTVDSSFTLDRFEVSNQQYADFLNQMLDRKQIRLSANQIRDAAGERIWAEIRPLDLDSDLFFSVADSFFEVLPGREEFPAVEVSWYGADAYARFYGRRLPTEAEWEYAARGTSKELGFRVYDEADTVGLGYPYPWGAGEEANRGNFQASGDPYENQGRVRTTPVGFYDGLPHGGYATGLGAGPYGTQDLAGNVWEWCADWYDLYRNPHAEPSAGHFRIVRGGSFNKPQGSARTYNRSYVDPEETDRAIGFRTTGTVVQP